LLRARLRAVFPGDTLLALAFYPDRVDTIEVGAEG
jgi:hypothetical protein